MKSKLIAAGIGISVLGIAGLTYAAPRPINLGGPAIVTAYAKREVLKVGMETTIIAHAANVSSGRIELYDENTNSYLHGDPIGGGVGFVVADFSAQTVTYQPVVEEAGLVHIQSGPAISVEWQVGANSTSNGYAAPNGAGANANYYTTGANSNSPTETTNIASYDMPDRGFNSEVFAEAYGGPVLENFTDLSNGASSHSSYSWSAPSNGNPMFYQMTAYAVPLVNGAYNYSEQAKAFAPTYVANEPANVATVPELATLGTNLQITGLTPGDSYWFSYLGFQTQDLKWQTVAANAEGVITIPLNRLGAVKILIGSSVNYTNVESPTQAQSAQQNP